MYKSEAQEKDPSLETRDTAVNKQQASRPLQVVLSSSFCLLLELEGEVIYQEKDPSLGVFNL